MIRDTCLNEAALLGPLYHYVGMCDNIDRFISDENSDFTTNEIVLEQAPNAGDKSENDVRTPPGVFIFRPLPIISQTNMAQRSNQPG